jgi:hypothetical protein
MLSSAFLKLSYELLEREPHRACCRLEPALDFVRRMVGGRGHTRNVNRIGLSYELLERDLWLRLML